MTKISASEVEPAKLSLTALCDHIVQTHHVYLRAELPRLLGFLNKIAIKHGDKTRKLIHLRNVFAKFMVDMLEHMDNEEEYVFAAARKLDQGIVASHDRGGHDPMHLMMEEHDEGAMALMKMRELSDNFTAPPDACETFKKVMADLARLERDVHEHVYKENCILAFKAEEAERRLLARA